MTLAVLIELQPFDPVGAASVAVRLCSHDDAALTALAGLDWWPAIARLPRLSLRFFDGTFSGAVQPGGGDMEVSLAVFPLAARYTWGDRPAKIWIGDLGAAWGSFTQIFDGLVRTGAPAGGRIALQLRVNDDWMDGPLLTQSYAGTGGAEGSADKKGVPKPLSIGAPRYVEGQLIDPVNTVVQLHGYGALNAVPVAMDRLVRFPAPVANYPDYASLVAASIAPGQFATATAVGMVRHGAPPDGVLSYMVEGDNGGISGFVRRPGMIIRRLAQIAGAADTQVDAASLNALDAAVPRNLSRFIGDQATPREVIGEIAASANASAGVSWMGQLFACRVVMGASPLLTLRTDGTALPPVGDPAQLEVAPPFWRMQMKGTRTARVHAQSEIALNATIVDLGDYKDAVTYREGNIVRQQADGRRYLYINAAPSAGVAPPATGYWSVYEEAPGSLITVPLPPDLAGFEVQVLGRTAYLSWPAIEDTAGLSHIVIKYQNVASGAAWPTSLPLLARLPIDSTGVSIPAVNGSYLIKAVNRNGTESTNALIAVIDLMTLDALNVVETVTENPSFAGVRTAVVEGAFGLQLDGGQSWDSWADVDAIADTDFGSGAPFAAEGFYDFANSVDLGAVYTSRLTADLAAFGMDIRASIDAVPDIDAMVSFDQDDPTLWDIELQVRTKNSPADPWGPWRVFTIGDYTARSFQWRARLVSRDANVTPVLVAASVTVDMPDRDERANDVPCPAAGLQVLFANAFRAPPAVNVTAQNMQTGDFWEIDPLLKNEAGFHIIFKNAAGAGVDRTFDWIAKGYGVSQ